MGAFGYLGSFLRIALPCRRELKNQGPGVTEIAQKSNNKCIWLWDCFGKSAFKEIIQSGLKNASNGTPNWTPKLAWCAGRTIYFHPWVNKVAQVVPNGAQSAPEGPQRPLEWSENVACGSKTSRKKRSSNESVSVREQGRGRGRSRRKGRGQATATTLSSIHLSPSGGPSSKVYIHTHIYIYIYIHMSSNKSIHMRFDNAFLQYIA